MNFAEAFVFDPLVATDPEGRDVPILASVVPTLENGGIGRDGLTITYHLRRGVRWQDGAPFTSRDVQFSYRAIMNLKTNVATRHGYDVIARVDTPDAHTAVFRLKHPFAPAVHTFFAHSDAPYFILPAHLLEKYPDLNRVPFNTLPVGTGPFKIYYRNNNPAGDGYGSDPILAHAQLQCVLGWRRDRGLPDQGLYPGAGRRGVDLRADP